MKKIGWFWLIGIGGVLAIAIFAAGQMGETNAAVARGRVVLADDLRQAAKGVHTLFIIVSALDSPMPYGAYRHTISGDPEGELERFALTNDNLQRMRPQEPWPEQFKLKARLDRDGTAGPDQPGDLVGELV